MAAVHNPAAAAPSYLWCDGLVQTADTFAVPVTDLGLLRGWGVFEAFRTHHGKLFHVADNFARLMQSAAIMGIPVPVSYDEFYQALVLLRQTAGLVDAYYRIILTGGDTLDGTSPLGPPRLIAQILPLPVIAAETYATGWRVITDNYQREPAAAKTLNYTRFMQLRPQLAAAQAQDVIYIADNQVLEASRSNVFVVKDNVVYTAADNILAGVTRKIILTLLPGQCEFVVGATPVHLLHTADEVFATSTGMMVMPITVIDGQPVGIGQPGPMTHAITRLFSDYTLYYQAAHP